MLLGCGSAEEIGPDPDAKVPATAGLRLINLTDSTLQVRMKGQLNDMPVQPGASSPSIRQALGEVSINFGGKSSDENSATVDLTSVGNGIVAIVERSGKLASEFVGVAPEPKTGVLTLWAQRVGDVVVDSVTLDQDGETTSIELARPVDIKPKGGVLSIRSAGKESTVPIDTLDSGHRAVLIYDDGGEVNAAVFRLDTVMNPADAANSP